MSYPLLVRCLPASHPCIFSSKTRLGSSGWPVTYSSANQLILCADCVSRSPCSPQRPAKLARLTPRRPQQIRCALPWSSLHPPITACISCETHCVPFSFSEPAYSYKLDMAGHQPVSTAPLPMHATSSFTAAGEVRGLGVLLQEGPLLKLSSPCLFINGDHDSLCPREALAASQQRMQNQSIKNVVIEVSNPLP